MIHHIPQYCIFLFTLSFPFPLYFFLFFHMTYFFIISSIFPIKRAPANFRPLPFSLSLSLSLSLSKGYCRYIFLLVYIHTLVQEVPPDKGKMVLKTLHGYKHSTSIFDDFIHYEKRQEEDEGRRVPPSQVSVSVFWVRKIFTDLDLRIRFRNPDPTHFLVIVNKIF
jgi:hypothetical protein